MVIDDVSSDGEVGEYMSGEERLHVGRRKREMSV